VDIVDGKGHSRCSMNEPVSNPDSRGGDGSSPYVAVVGQRVSRGRAVPAPGRACNLAQRGCRQARPCHQARSGGTERTTPDRAPAWRDSYRARSGVVRSGVTCTR
jgi:hypothetical protein